MEKEKICSIFSFLTLSSVSDAKERENLNLWLKSQKITMVRHVSFVKHPQDIAWNPRPSGAEAYFSLSEVKGLGWDHKGTL